jgi:glutathione S-transferase
MSAPILHHYWGSPYAEKIRILLGYKNASWLSAEIPVTPPRPGLASILGEFRRTPVLQLGADYFCDSRLIVEVIDQHIPTPALRSSENAALSEFLCGWVEPRVFALLGPVRFRTPEDVEGIFGGQVGVAEFSADRLPFMQPVYDAQRYFELHRTSQDHLRRFLGALEDYFAGGSDFIGGARPTHGDFSAYHTTWWLRCPPAHTEFLAAFPRLGRWADRMANFGHGSHTPIGAPETLVIASAPTSKAWRWERPDPSDDLVGREVAISADDYGKGEIHGRIVATSDRDVTLEREVDGVGSVRVHFPRLGYEITTV